MKRTIIKNCIATLGPHLAVSGEVLDIVISGSTITEIRPGVIAGADDVIVQGEGRLVTAGLINGHLHSNEHYHKGRYDNLPLEVWIPFIRPLKPLVPTPRQVYLRTMVGAIEALRSGTTTVVDDLVAPATLEREHVEAAMQAYEDIGIRALIGPSIIDQTVLRTVPYLEEELPPALLAQLTDQPDPDPAPHIALILELARSRHPASSRVACLVTPSAPQRCSEALLKRLRNIAREYALPAIIHVQETRLQVVTGMRRFDSTLIQYLSRIGFLAPATSLVHAVWVNPREVDLIARAGATVQHNPLSNLKLGSGLAPVAALLAAGVNVSLGSDGCSSTDTLDMLKVVSATALLHKLRGSEPENWLGAVDAWRAGTQAGATALGLGDRIGTVEVGRRADLVIWRLDRIPFVPLNNPLQQLVYAGDKSCLDSVIVDGHVVVHNGQLSTIDEQAIMAEIREEHAKLLPQFERMERQARELVPYYRRVYDRCMDDPIAADTYPGRLEH
jgi:guanine deaminase